MPISYKHKIYTTLGTPTDLSGDVVSATDSAGVPAKDYTVKGKTIVWNQLLDKSKYPATTTTNGVTFTNNGDFSNLNGGKVIGEDGRDEYFVKVKDSSHGIITSDKIRLHILPINVNYDQGKFGISSVGYNNTTTQVPVDSFKVSKINELLGIDPAKKFTSTPVTDNVITTLTGMFGYDAYNYEIESANLKAEFARRVTKLPNGNYKFYDAFNKKEVIKSTEEEIKKELSIYLSNLNDSRVEQVQKIKEEFLPSVLN